MEWVKEYELKAGNVAMAELLKKINEWNLKQIDELEKPIWLKQQLYKFQKPLRAQLVTIRILLEKGKTDEAITLLEGLSTEFQDESHPLHQKYHGMLGVAYLRWGEQENCIFNHSNNSCILPIKGDGVYTLQEKQLMYLVNC